GLSAPFLESCTVADPPGDQSIVKRENFLFIHQHIQPARFMFESGNTGDKLMVMLKKRGLGNVFACYEGRAYENLACFSRVEVAVVNTPLRYYCQTIQGHPLECRYL